MNELTTISQVLDEVSKTRSNLSLDAVKTLFYIAEHEDDPEGVLATELVQDNHYQENITCWMSINGSLPLIEKSTCGRITLTMHGRNIIHRLGKIVYDPCFV